MLLAWGISRPYGAEATKEETAIHSQGRLRWVPESKNVDFNGEAISEHAFAYAYQWQV